MAAPLPGDELLFDDLDGARVGLDDVIADGLDRDYPGRYPALRELPGNGTPAQRLHACVVLASWGVRDGFLTDVYLHFGGPVAGARVPEPHGGQYVDLFTVGCTPVDVEAVVAPLGAAVKVHYDDPDRSIAYLAANGRNLRVLVETRRGRDTMVVAVHFP